MTEKAHRREALLSWVITAGLTVAFLLFLKLNATQTFELFEIPFALSIPAWRAVVFFITALFIGIYIYRIGLDLFGGLTMGLMVFVGASTLYNQGDMMVWARDWLRCLATVCVVGTLTKTRLRELLRAFYIASSFYLICDLVFIFQTQHGLYFNSMIYMFFGNHTETFKIAIPAFICSAALDSLEMKKISINTWVVFGLGIVDLLVGCSVNALTVQIIVAVLVVLVQCEKIRSALNGISFGLFFGVADVLIVGARAHKILSGFIEGVLHKSATLTGRDGVWDAAGVLLDKRHILTGYGCSYGDGLLRANGRSYIHAHNEALHILLSGGLGAAACWLALLVLAGWNLFRFRKDKTISIFAVGLFGFLIIGIFEAITVCSFYFLLALSFYGSKSNCEMAPESICGE